jgi:hypothetical protein
MFALNFIHSDLYCYDDHDSEYSTYEIIFERPDYKIDGIDIIFNKFVVCSIELLEVYNKEHTGMQWKFVIKFETSIQWEIFQMITNSEVLNILKSANCIFQNNTEVSIIMNSDEHCNVVSITKNGITLPPECSNMYYILAELIQEQNYKHAGQFIMAA